MKKVILFAAILFAGFSVVKAQTASDNVSLNVKLHPIQTIVVNGTQKTVNLDYITVTNYGEGVTSLQEDHLKVYSTGAFQVQVASSLAQIERAEGSETIESTGISVTASEGSTNPLTGGIVGSVNLSTTAENLFSNTVGGVNVNYNITYKGDDTDAYVNKYFNSENPTVYTTTVTYTIAPI